MSENILDNKTIKYLKTPETKNLPLGAKFVISIPDDKDTSEFGNFVNMLCEIKRDNPDYIIEKCETCDECGATNDTVEEITIPQDIDDGRFESQKKKLCDYCERGYE